MEISLNLTFVSNFSQNSSLCEKQYNKLEIVSYRLTKHSKVCVKNWLPSRFSIHFLVLYITLVSRDVPDAAGYWIEPDSLDTNQNKLV